MSVSTKAVNGALVWYENDYTTERWLDALGEDVMKFDLAQPEPLDASAVLLRLVATEVEAGGANTVISIPETAGKILSVITDSNEYDGINVQAKGEAFKLETDKPLYFGAKLLISDATESDLLVGMCELKTDLLKTSAAHGITSTNVEGFFFYKVDGATAIYAKVYKDGAEVGTKTLTPVMDTSAHVYEFYWDGSMLYAYFDGEEVARFSPTFPDGDLTPSFNFRAGAAAQKTIDIYWMRAIECR